MQACIFLSDRNLGKPHDKQANSGETPGAGRIRLAQRARIIACAERVFADHGFGGATMTRIAEAAGLPKANLHYYFGTKHHLYRAVLENILALWLDDMDPIVPENDPAAALAAYIAAKMAHSRNRPHASKVFAAELLRGAPELRAYLGLDLRRKVAEKSAVIEGWIARGLIAPVDPRHLFFTIWAMTQTYADFDSQMAAVLGIDKLGAEDYATGTTMVTRLVLRGLGIAPIGETPIGEIPIGGISTQQRRTA